MTAGDLQQIDTPQQLYPPPANIFVAGFIGSPSMNFFDAQLTDEGGQLYVNTGNFKIHAPPSRTELYRPHAGKTVILAIRPEAIHDLPIKPSNILPSQIDANVD